MHNHPSDEGRFEKSDVHPRLVVFVGVALVVSVLVTFGIGYIFTENLRKDAPISDFVPHPLSEDHQTFASPVRLQVDPPAEFAALHTEQSKEATTYGIVSQEPEVYRIPVEKAMELIATHGFPEFPALEPVEAATDTKQPAGS